MTAQLRIFPEIEYEYHRCSKESDRQRQIRRAVELWERYIPEELHHGECTFTVGTIAYVLGKMVGSRRTARGVINGISCYGRCIVLERNPAYRSGTKDEHFLSTWDILPEDVRRVVL